MIELTTLKCPECGGSLDIPENVNHIFCKYCGTKILLSNDNEKIVRHVDEAAIRKSEIDRELKLRQLENDMREKRNDRIIGALAFLFMILLAIGLIIVGTFFN